MKKLISLLCLAMVFFAMKVSAQWSYVGAPGFSNGTSFNTSLAFDGTTPYVACTDFGAGLTGKVVVKKFDGSTWINVGTPGFSAGGADYVSLVINNGTPYVAFQDFANAYKATVMKYDGSAWVYVGQAGFSDGSVAFTSLTFDGTTPYIAFKDNAYNGKACVMTFDGTSWAHVSITGISAFSAGDAEFTSIAINNGTPYVAYKDTGIVALANVMKFNGVYWEEVGNGLANPLGFGNGFSDGTALYTKIAFDGNVPYVAYADAAWNFSTVVKYFDGTNWQYLGTPGFSGSEAADISFTIV